MTFYRFFWWLAYGLAVVLFRLRVEGRHHIPQSGALILAANHCSYVDPIIIGVAAGRELWYLLRLNSFLSVAGKLIHRLPRCPFIEAVETQRIFLAWTKTLQGGNPCHFSRRHAQ